MKNVLLLFLTWRVFLWIPLFFGYLLNSRNGYEYTLFSDFLRHERVIDTLGYFLSSFANFDGVHYITIAAHGYNVNAGFFPLFPLILAGLGRVFSIFIPLDLPILLFYIGLFINSAFLILGLFFFSKLLKFDYKDNVVFSIIIFLLSFPTAFFFATIYAETLFFLLTTLVFYFSRKQKWFLVALFGCLLTATRPVGIAIIPALIYELYFQKKISFKELLIQPLKNASFWFQASYVSIISMLGIGVYSIFNYFKWNDFLFFIHAQGEFENNRSVTSIILFPQTVFRYIKILFTLSSSQFEWWVALLELSTFFIVSLLLFIAWKKKVRKSYLVFAIISFLIPISTGTFSSLPRYVLTLFPIFIALAMFKSKAIKILYVLIGVVLQILLFLLFSKGYFVS